MHDEIAKEMQHAAGILLAEAAHHAVGAARVEREDRLEMRRALARDVQLLGAEPGNADHADIAVAPALLRDPLYQVITVPHPRSAAAVGLANAAGRADDMDIAARDEESGVAGFQETGPERGPCRLRRQRAREIGALQVLVVDGEGEQCRKLLVCIRPVDVDGQVDAVARGHGNVLLGDHARIGRRPIVGDGRSVACRRQADGLARRRHARGGVDRQRIGPQLFRSVFSWACAGLSRP
ncbi:MAG TPA: hypothetical protein VH678_21645 [Xanthobacteraceae bacterium]|jgi:hypothetical protein